MMKMEKMMESTMENLSDQLSRVRLFASIAVLVSFLPGLLTVWNASNAGEAERIWIYGIPGSPLLTIKQIGVGQFNDITWLNTMVSFHPVSFSFLSFIVGAGVLMFCSIRRESGQG